MFRQFVMGIALTVATATAYGQAPAEPPQHGRMMGKRMGGKHKRLHEELNLTADQATKIKEIHVGKRARMQELRKEMQDKMQAFAKAYAENDDKAAIESAFRAVEESKRAMAQLHLESLLEIRAILTPEQRKMFVASRPGMGGRMMPFDQDEPPPTK